MQKIRGRLIWAGISVAAAFSLAVIAENRGEPINSIWLFIAAKVMALDNKRATPAERLRDGHDFEPTNKWIVFGHHFAAIAGPGPLVGPTLAAQFGYLPGFLWIVIGATLGGAVQDFVILFASMRRDGKSLGQIAREEVGSVGGFTALVTVLLIMIILLAVVALVVVDGRLFTLSPAGQGAGVLPHGLCAGGSEHLRRPMDRGFEHVGAGVFAQR